MAKKKPKQSWDMLQAEHDLEQKELKYKSDKLVADTAYDDRYKSQGENFHLSKADLQTSWEKMRHYAKVNFPEGAEFVSLTGPQKVCGVASALGWSAAKIHTASKIPVRTVSSWLARSDVKLFIDSFNLKEGRKSIMDLVDRTQYAAINTIKELMLDKRLPGHTRLQAATWLVERRHGKASQTIEHKGNMLKDLMEAIQGNKEIPKARIAELFPESKETH